MKKQTRVFPVITILFIFCFAACTNKDPVHVKTNTELVSQSTWKFDNAKVGGTDVSAFVQACQKDNIIAFVSTGSGTLDEGASKCNSGDPQTTPFTWNFASSETMLHISTTLFTGGSSDFTIVTLSETQLILSQNITITGMGTQNAVITFKH
jgi:hypothetical protein